MSKCRKCRTILNGACVTFCSVTYLLKENVFPQGEKKFLSGKYHWSNDCIEKREKCKEIVSSVVVDNGAALQFQESKLSRAKNFLPIR